MDYRWYVELVGDDLDLSEMQRRLRTGSSRIAQNNGRWYLGSREFEDEDSESKVYSIATEIVSVLNLSFKTALEGFEDVGIGAAIMEITPEGPKIYFQTSFTCTLRLRDSVGEILINGRPPPTTTSLAEKLMECARNSADFQAALRAFNANPPTFADLYIAMETVKRVHDPFPHANPKKRTERGARAIVDRGWATDDELLDFNATANHFRHGHPRDPIDRPEMSMEVAVCLVRRLLHRWVE